MRKIKLNVDQLRSLIGQLVETFCLLSSEKKFVHGNLDSRSVFVREEADEIRVFVDPTEHHMLTRLLKQN